LWLFVGRRSRTPSPKKPKKPKPVEEATEEMEEYRRPTVGDRVMVRDTMVMKRYLPEAIGKVFRIIKDDKGSTPYRLAGVGEQRHWFSEIDVCWPPKVTKAEVKAKAKPKPENQPEKIMVTFNRYGCTAGEVREVLGETADKKSWVCKGGRQVPKMHEGKGWTRVESDTPPPPSGPPPSGPPPQVFGGDDIDAEMLAQMEEMQAQLDAEATAAPTPPPPPPPGTAAPSPAAPAPAASTSDASKPPANASTASVIAADAVGKDAAAAADGKLSAKAKKRQAAALEGAARREARKKRLAEAEKSAQPEAVVSDDEPLQVKVVDGGSISLDD